MQTKLEDSEKTRNELLESSKKLINVHKIAFLREFFTNSLLISQDIKRDNQDLVGKLQKLSENCENLEKKLRKAEFDKTLLENQLISLGLFPYRYTNPNEKTEKTQTNTINSIDETKKTQKNVRKSSKNRSPEPAFCNKKGCTPQILLNNLINQQKKLKIEGNFSRKAANSSFNANISQNPQDFCRKAGRKPEIFARKCANFKENRDISHNNSVAVNQSVQESLENGCIRPRSKSSHARNKRNNQSFSFSNKENTEKNKKRLEKSLENCEPKTLVFNFLRLKNQVFNKISHKNEK